MLSPFPDRSPFVGTDGVPQPWAQRWMQELRNLVNAPIPGPFTNDASAAAAKVAIGKPYYTPTGQMQIRIR